ncbi:MAG: DUF447 domain-containing protein [Planctomycetota bacterium]
MILESIVTTVDVKGIVNVAPMGPMVEGDPHDPGRPMFVLRPWEGSRTCHNLLTTNRAVIHVVDDATLIADAVLGTVDPVGLTVAVGSNGHWHRLINCHRWFAVETSRVERPLNPARCERLGLHREPCIDGRHELWAETIQSGVEQPFFGFNRARHAIIEAAILASRVQHLPTQAIESQLKLLRIAVDKTGEQAERDAMGRLEAYIQRQLESGP